jgi:putative ATP-dependent endonuclease of the OLD family
MLEGPKQSALAQIQCIWHRLLRRTLVRSVFMASSCACPAVCLTCIMIIDNSVKIRDYKCFGHEEQGFEKILPINIIIGKNNSGKSSLLDLIEFLIDPDKDIIAIKNGITKCILSLTITENVIKEVISDYAKTSGSKDEVWFKPITDHCNERNNIVSKNVSFSIESHNEIILINNKNNYGQYQQSFLRVFNSFFKNKVFKRINAERDITPETFYAKDSLNSNGKNATNIIWKYLAIKGYDQNLIRKDF